MYATRFTNEIYHLVLATGDHTLCGLRISRIPFDAKLPGNLRRVPEVPPNKSVCKHCERIKSQTN